MAHPDNIRRELARIGVGIIEMPNPIPRGKPDGRPGETWGGKPVLVHMHKKQHRPGMQESFSPWGDFQPDTICGNGSYHLWMCDDPNFVTCPKCLSKMVGKFEITPAWEAAKQHLALLEKTMDDEMNSDDYKVSPCGHLGGKTGVSCEGVFLGEFNEIEEALQFIAERMEEENYFPSIWWVSDHGNAWLIDKEGNEIKN